MFDVIGVPDWSGVPEGGIEVVEGFTDGVDAFPPPPPPEVDEGGGGDTGGEEDGGGGATLVLGGSTGGRVGSELGGAEAPVLCPFANAMAETRTHSANKMLTVLHRFPLCIFLFITSFVPTCNSQMPFAKFPRPRCRVNAVPAEKRKFDN